MPTAPQHLRERWNDETALAQIAKAGLDIKHGVIRVRPDVWPRLSRETRDAIDYLVMEWDYGAGWLR